MTEPKYTEPGWYVFTRNGRVVNTCWWEVDELKEYYANPLGSIYKLYPVPDMTEQLGEPGKEKSNG